MAAMMLPRLPRQVENLLTDVVDRAGIGGIEPIRRLVSRIAINRFGYSTTLRPRALSLASDYTSWMSLTDRTYSGRHLPPSTPEYQAELPSEADVVALYRRETLVPADRTSVMFMFFAQWFTDSFLRSDATDFRKNESNHEIDLCQIYGRTIVQTNLLRAFEGGRLKSQMIKGEEYPEFLFQSRTNESDPFVFKPEFDGLFDPDYLMNTILRSAPDAQKEKFFAVGLEHGNSTIGNTIMNTLALREHNRLAGILAEQNSGWDDEQVFQTARNIAIVLLLKLVVEQYITHIGPFDFPVEVVPFIADEERWNRTNWCAVEFNLLYRWHPLVPDTIGSGPGSLSSVEFRNNNALVLDEGIEALMKKCSTEFAGKIGLMNTPTFLVDTGNPAWPSVEQVTVDLMRKAHLRSYNDYREAYGLKRMTKWTELTTNTTIIKRLEGLYGDIEQLEWYVGIFAEEYPDYMMMGELMTYMVANDAFTQALTNPLLARNVFNEATFTETGMKIIRDTASLQDIVKRNAAKPDEVYANFEIENK
jgi:prostaglandin-endoperoxide synthase 2